jgi:hypothetical protein
MSGYRSNEFSTGISYVSGHERGTSPHSQGILSVFLSTRYYILSWKCEVQYIIQRRRFRIDYLCALFVGDTPLINPRINN